MIANLEVRKIENKQFHYFLFKLQDERIFNFTLNQEGVQLQEVNQLQDRDERLRIQSCSNENQELTINYIEQQVIPIIQKYNSVLYNSVDFINDVINNLQEKFRIRLELVDDYNQLIPVVSIVALGKFKLKSFILAGLIVFFTGQTQREEPELTEQTFRRSMTMIKKGSWMIIQRMLRP